MSGRGRRRRARRGRKAGAGRRATQVGGLCVLALLVVLTPAPAAAQDGSLGAAVVGGMTGGAAALWAFGPLTGCPVVTVGASRGADACDAGALVAGLGGVAAGVWVGASNSGAGYGMGVGAVAGFATALLASQVTEVPRWLNALLVVGGSVAGGLLWADDAPTP